MFSTREGGKVRGLGSSEVWASGSGATEQPAPAMDFLLFNEKGHRGHHYLHRYLNPTGFPLCIKEEDLQVKG